MPLLFSLLIFLIISLLISSFSFTHHYKKQHHANNCNPKYSYPLIGSLISFYQNRHRLIHWYTHLLSLSTTQTIVLRRLGACRTIITANPNNVEYILNSNFNNYPKGKLFNILLGDFLGFGIFNVDGKLWNAQRKIASHEFSTRSLREFTVKVLEDEVQSRLIPLLEMASGNGDVLDLQQLLRCFAFDTICRVSLGMDPCCLDFTKPPLKMVNAFDTASEISAKRGVAPFAAVWKAKKLFNVGSEKKLREAVELVHASVLEIIRTKREKLMKNKGNNTSSSSDQKDDENDLLSRLLTSGNDDILVRDMVISFLMAGRDTTSAAMTWLFWLLSNNKHVEKDLLHEIMSINNGACSKGLLGFEELKKMTYMKACLCESMRLYPPVVWDSKHAAGDDILPDGTPVYKGDRVTYFPYGMGRMEELWGNDKLEFRPDRWFDEPGVLKLVSPYKFPVFQAGPRVCLGKEMAFIQMKYVVSSVLSRFEIKPVCLEEPVFVPLLTAHMAGGFKIRVCRRG